MKNFKMLIIGLIIGLTISMGIFAIDYVINPNPYPIVVNGQQEEIQALNIDGFTYLKIADVAKVLNASVKFNEVDKQIEINQNITATTNNTEVSTMSTTTLETTKLTPDGIEAKLNVLSGKYRVYLGGFKTRYYKTEFKIDHTLNDPYALCIKKNNEVIVNNLQLIDGASAFDYDYYCNTILPNINK